MGCCQTKQNLNQRTRIRIGKHDNSAASATSATSVTSQSPPVEESEQFLEYARKLKQTYNYKNHKSVWFNTRKPLKIDESYLFETQNYVINCTITDLNEERSLGFKFALIAPEWSSPPTQNQKNLFFVYCKEQKLPTSQKIVPVAVKIENIRAQKQKGSFQFAADLNGVVKMHLHLQSKEKM